MNQPLVIKVGGSLLTSKAAQIALFNTIYQLQQQEITVILVHGGGDLVARWLSQMGAISDKIQGLRVTPKTQIDVVAGALAGAANKQLVANAKHCQLNAIGISLCDGNMVKTQYLTPELGQVGRCIANDKQLLDTLINGGFTPVISSIADDGEGNLMNVNADDAAQVIAQLIKGKLIFLSDVPGVLDDKKSLIKVLTLAHAEQLMADNVIAGGMQVKVKTAFTTAKSLNDSIVITSWKQPEDLLNIVTGGTCGTLITP